MPTTGSPLPESRKRPRSSSSSTSSASSPKRSASEDPSQSLQSDTPNTGASSPHLPPLPTLDGAMTPTDREIDMYMASQDSADTAAGPSDQASAPSQCKPEHLTTINNLKKKSLVKGDTYYLVARTWLRRWEHACSGGVDKDDGPQDVGPVDNSTIADGSGRLFTQLIEGVTVEYLPEEAWKLLVAWYGIPSLVFPRKVIQSGNISYLHIELHPPTLRVVFLPAQPETTITVSSQSTLSEVVAAIPNLPQIYRLWNVDPMDTDRDEDTITVEWVKSHNPQLILSDDISMRSQALKITVNEALLQNNDIVVVEHKKPGTQWPLTLPESKSDNKSVTVYGPQLPKNTSDYSPKPLFQSGSDFFSTKYPSSFSSGSKAVAEFKSSSFNKPAIPPRPRGTMGLVNLGNTCFMNSALQCLAHIEELTSYFLSGVYLSELNPDNPLSTGGVLAKSYGSLMHNLFPSAATTTSFAPRDLKYKISQHAPAFSGYAQHDTQELLAFLLDGLHEDLNRILKKPYVEKPDWEGGGLKELAKLAQTTWDGYERRNDSVIVDLFQGQYKSTLVCPQCSKVSITFDPFMYLTLPLPVTRTWKNVVQFVPWDHDKPHVETQIELPRNQSIKHLKQTLGRWYDVDPEKIFAAEHFNHRFFKFLPDNSPLADIQDRDKLIFYELPISARQSEPYKPSPDDPVIIPVFHVQKSKPMGFRRFGYGSHYGGWDGRQPWALPFLIVLTPQEASTFEGIYAAVIDRFQRWTTRAENLFKWEAIDDTTTPTEEMSSDMEEVDLGASVPLTPPSEGDDFVKVSKPDAGDATPTITSSGHRMIGPQEDLFKMWLHESGEVSETVMETGWHMESHGRLVDWEERVRAVGGSGSVPGAWTSIDRSEASELESDGASASSSAHSLLKLSDALICEWNDQHHLYFFGDNDLAEESLWNVWEKHIHPEIEAQQAAAAAKRKRGINLEDCLDEFTLEEKLGEDDLWYCPQCKKHQQATKKFEIWKVPDILVVHLKRFSNSRMLRDKIDSFVDFPIDGLNLEHRVEERKVARSLVEEGVNLSELGIDTNIDEPLIFDLCAVDEHMGGLGGGHYRAYCKNPDDSQWYHFDDSHVSKAQATDAVNSNAYLLFYKRRTSRPIGGRTYEKVKQALAQNDSTQLATPPEDPPPAVHHAKSSDWDMPPPLIGPPTFAESFNDRRFTEEEDDYSLFRSQSLTHRRLSGSSLGAEPDDESGPALPSLSSDEDYDNDPDQTAGGSMSGVGSGSRVAWGSGKSTMRTHVPWGGDLDTPEERSLAESMGSNDPDAVDEVVEYPKTLPEQPVVNITVEPGSSSAEAEDSKEGV